MSRHPALASWRCLPGWVVCLYLTLAILLLLGPAPVMAQDGLRISANEVSSAFGQEVRFHLIAEADTPIQEVALLHRVTGNRVTSREHPDFEPARKVDVEWILELVPGALPPGARITYYWLLQDGSGNELRTPERTYEYEDDRFDWREYQAGLVHLFAYDGKQREPLLDTALASLETLQQDIGVTLEQPIQIYVYANKRDMRLALPSRSERYDEMTTTLGMVVSDDTLLLLGNDSDIERTLTHELSHIVVGLATANPLGGLPRWLDEGLAMYAEGELNAINRLALESAIRNDDLISVRSLSGYSGDPDQVDLFYAEAHSLVSFMLQEYGRDKMLALLKTFKEGAYQEDALQEVYGFGLDELNARWRQSLGLPPHKPLPAPSATVHPGEKQEAPSVCSLGLLPAVLALTVTLLLGARGARP